jgi:heptosyltransferase-2
MKIQIHILEIIYLFFKNKQQSGLLIIKLGALGDSVMALGLLMHLQENYPKKLIYWIGSRAYQDLFALLDLKNLIYLPVSGELARQRHFLGKLKISYECFKHLLSFKWEKIFLCHKDKRYRYLLWCSFLNHHLVSAPRFLNIAGRYHGEEYVRLYFGSDGNCKIPFSLPKIKLTDSKVASRAILAPGGQMESEPGKKLRQWPVKYYAELAQYLIKKGYEVVLIGVQSDEQIDQAFKNLAVNNLIGQQSLKACIETIGGAGFVVTCDSGSMHLALLTRTMVYAVFGPTLAQEKLPLGHPEFSKNIQVFGSKNKLSCSPCYDGKHYAKCVDPICMKLITPLEVIKKIDENSLTP